MPRRNTGYASLGGKLNLIHSLFFSFIFSFFCVCVWPILFQPMFFFLERSTKIDLDARRFDVWVGKAYNVVPAKKNAYNVCPVG